MDRRKGRILKAWRNKEITLQQATDALDRLEHIVQRERREKHIKRIRAMVGMARDRTPAPRKERPDQDTTADSSWIVAAVAWFFRDRAIRSLDHQNAPGNVTSRIFRRAWRACQLMPGGPTLEAAKANGVGLIKRWEAASDEPDGDICFDEVDGDIDLLEPDE